MYYNFNPTEKTLKFMIFADSCNENLEQDLSELFHNMNFTKTIRIVDTLYKIKKTKTKISIIEMPFEKVIAEYTNYSGMCDITEFLTNQINWLSDRNSNTYNSDSIDNIINNPKEKFIYLFGGYDFGYKIGIVDNKVVLITPEGEKLSTDCDIDNISIDFLNIVLDSMIKKDLYVNDVLSI